MSLDANALVALLREKSLKIALAESCTGGFVAKLITDIDGSSSVFECGIVSYSNGIKSSVLGVSEDSLQKYGAVSETVAREMAKGALRVSGADIAVGISGIAGPRSDNTQKPVGLIYISVANRNTDIVQEFRTAFCENIRENNRCFAAENALRMAEKFISDNYS